MDDYLDTTVSRATFTNQIEAERLFKILLNVECQPGFPWTLERCEEIAPLTRKINDLKKEKNAIILAHSYVNPEIVYGVADFKSDSYALSLEARNADADIIIFAGVVFMAETAKILCPDATVIVPDVASGCSLADSLTGKQLITLKDKYPEAAVVCYINSSAEVKAESDVCVTSSNVYHIIEKLEQREILFVPDQLMAINVQNEMNKRNIDKIIHSSAGTCIVHDQYNAEAIKKARKQYPGIVVVSHPECNSEVTKISDFVGSTGKMMEFVKNSDAPYFMMLTECGLVSRLEVENPNKRFVASCRLCPYMKLNSLQKIYTSLTNPHPEHIVEIDEEIRLSALKSIDRMFELSN